MTLEEEIRQASEQFSAQGRNERMNGAESLVRTLAGAGVEVCFANPGTSEMHFVVALDRVGGYAACSDSSRAW